MITTILTIATLMSASEEPPSERQQIEDSLNHEIERNLNGGDLGSAVDAATAAQVVREAPTDGEVRDAYKDYNGGGDGTGRSYRRSDDE